MPGQDHIYVGRTPGAWKWSTDYGLISEWAGGEENVSIMHKRGREYVLDLSEHPDAIENQWCSMNRQYDCGHVAYGPPRLLPEDCPECHSEAVSPEAVTDRWCPCCQWTRPENVVPGGPPVCPGCNEEYPSDAPERSYTPIERGDE